MEKLAESLPSLDPTLMVALHGLVALILFFTSQIPLRPIRSRVKHAVHRDFRHLEPEALRDLRAAQAAELEHDQEVNPALRWWPTGEILFVLPLTLIAAALAWRGEMGIDPAGALRIPVLALIAGLLGDALAKRRCPSCPTRLTTLRLEARHGPNCRQCGVPHWTDPAWEDAFVVCAGCSGQVAMFRLAEDFDARCDPAFRPWGWVWRLGLWGLAFLVILEPSRRVLKGCLVVLLLLWMLIVSPRSR